MLCPKLLQCSKLCPKLIQKLQTRNFCEKNKLCTIIANLHVFPWLSCHDLAMILTSVPCIMICHDLDKGTTVNHDLARFTMIIARVAWLQHWVVYSSNNHQHCQVLLSDLNKTPIILNLQNYKMCKQGTKHFAYLPSIV